MRTPEASKFKARVKRIAGSRERRAAENSAKANVDIAALELIDVELLGVVEDGMPGRNVQRKPGTARGSPRRSRSSEGIAYKPPCGEIAMCPRVGRMGPIK